jgi:hypothetical protein
MRTHAYAWDEGQAHHLWPLNFLQRDAFPASRIIDGSKRLLGGTVIDSGAFHSTPLSGSKYFVALNPTGT